MFNEASIGHEEQRRREVAPNPVTLGEFREATESALDFGDKHLGLWSADGTELSTIAFEEWTDVSMELDDIFFDANGGVLGAQLLKFAELDDAELPHIRSEALRLIAQTALVAQRMSPLIDRLCAVMPTMSRKDVIEKLREGEVLKTKTADYQAIQSIRRSLLGVLSDLEERLEKVTGDEEKTQEQRPKVWNFDEAVRLAPSIIPHDPFASDEETKRYWIDRGGDFLSVSSRKTESLLYELEVLRRASAESKEKATLVGALDVIERWIDRNALMYDDTTGIELNTYHLGMESKEEMNAVFCALDVVKHDNPKFFVSLMGINPAGGKSPYFGNFIHKALFNTQEYVDDCRTIVGDVGRKDDAEKKGARATVNVFTNSLAQLFLMNGTVPHWDFDHIISEAGFKALQQKMQKQIAAEPDEKKKIALATAWAQTLIKPSAEAQFAKQIDIMREGNLPELKAKLFQGLDDHEHPLVALDTIALLPRIAFRDPVIKERLTAVFGEDAVKKSETLRKNCTEKSPEVVRAIFDQIPMFDYENAKMGNFISIALQTAMNREGRLGTMLRWSGSGVDHEEKTFLKNIFHNRAVTKEVILENIKNDKERKFVQDLNVDLDPHGDFGLMFSEITLDALHPQDRSFYSANWNVRHNSTALIYGISIGLSDDDLYSLRRGNTISEKYFDEVRKICIAQATLGDGKGAKILLDGFDQFRLRKPDAAKVVKVIFEHLPKLTSYEKFEFLLKHAEKFEDQDVMDFLTWLPVESGLLREIVLATSEKYPPVFLEYIKTLHQFGEKKDKVWTRFIDTIVESLLDEDDLGEGDLWTEEHVMNFAKTPGFDEVFVKYAKKIFEAYPNLPEKLYGEWGARMVKELEIVEVSPEFLKRMGELCPRDGSDDVMGKWEKLLALRKSVRGDERVVEKKEMRELRHMVSGLISDIMREFPEVIHEGYREMRELFRERMLGFAEVERAFRVGEEKMVEIGFEERIRAQNQLEEKMNELDVKKCLEYLRNDPEEKERWMLIYRAEDGRGRDYSPGWFFVQCEPDEDTRRKNIVGEFSVEKQQERVGDVARRVGIDPAKIRQRSIRETIYDMTVAKELLSENPIEGIWKEESGSSFVVEMSNGHPAVFNIVDVPSEKAGMCVMR